MLLVCLLWDERLSRSWSSGSSSSNSLVSTGAECPGAPSPLKGQVTPSLDCIHFKILELPNHMPTFLSFFFLNSNSDHISHQQMELTENRGTQILAPWSTAYLKGNRLRRPFMEIGEWSGGNRVWETDNPCNLVWCWSPVLWLVRTWWYYTRWPNWPSVGCFHAMILKAWL